MVDNTHFSNTYGDVFVPTTGRHGANITEQRKDELDQACLDFVALGVKQKSVFQTVDIGGGAGMQSKLMAELGAKALLIDLTDQKTQIDAFNNRLGRQAIEFIQSDVRLIRLWPNPVDCVYSQRMLSFLPYGDAVQVLKSLRSVAAKGARFFFSSGGLESELGTDYPDYKKPVTERFAPLSSFIANKHNLCVPLCLYREGELRVLAETVGLEIESSRTSSFGNPKIIAFNP